MHHHENEPQAPGMAQHSRHCGGEQCEYERRKEKAAIGRELSPIVVSEPDSLWHINRGEFRIYQRKRAQSVAN